MERHKLYDGKVTMQYDDGPHTYTVDGVIYPSVTKITGMLDKPALRHWYVNRSISYISEQIYPGVPYDEIQLKEIFKDAKYGGARARDHAATIGKDVHEWIEKHITHQIATGKKHDLPMPVHTGMQSSISKFLAWEEKTKPTYLMSEKRMVSIKHTFSGTVDIVYIDETDCTVIADIKTGKNVYPEHHLQTGGYAVMLKEEMPETFMAGNTMREIIHIPLVGELKIKNPTHDINTDMEAFIALSKVYHWKETK